MKQVHYLRGCLALPIVVPLLALPLAFFRLDSSGVSDLLGFSLFMGGIPYLAFGAVSAVVLWRRPTRSYWRYASLAPLIFIPVYVICFISYEAFSASPVPVDSLLVPVLVHSGFILVIGYAYVVVAWAAYWVLRWRSRFDDVA